MLLLEAEELLLQGIEIPAADFLHLLLGNRNLRRLYRALHWRLHHPNLFARPLHERAQLAGSLRPRLQIHDDLPMRHGFFLLCPSQLELVDDQIYLFRKHALDEVQRLVVYELDRLFLLYVVLEFRAVHIFGLDPFVGLLVIV